MSGIDNNDQGTILTRHAIHQLQESKIREVANAGLGRSDVLPFWFGEGDEVTPHFIRQAAIDALQSGETFYAHNLGLPELRQAIAAYTTRLHGAQGRVVGPERIAVTAGGVSALMLAMQALIDPGDEVVAVTPVWPNLTAQPLILGARLTCVSLRPQAGAWKLDMQALLSAVSHTTRLLILNSPNNPTGWTLSREEQLTILSHCRKTGTWILADEVYERLFFGQPGGTQSTIGQQAHDDLLCAPSFLDIADPQDRLVVAHSFSKSFLMTGWRLGWLVMPAEMTHDMGKLIEFNTSCCSVFVQRAGVAALERHAEVTPPLVAHLKTCRDTLLPLLSGLNGVEVAPAPGGMYAFFRLHGFDDSLATAKRLVMDVGLGLAPGEAFSPQAGAWLRWCFASREPARLVLGVDRLKNWLSGYN